MKAGAGPLDAPVYSRALPTHQVPPAIQPHKVDRPHPGIVVTQRTAVDPGAVPDWHPRMRAGYVAQQGVAVDFFTGWTSDQWGPQDHLHVQPRLVLGAQGAAIDHRFASYRFLDTVQ